MDLSSIKQVVTLESDKEVNRYLEAGWTLLSVYTTAYDSIGPGVNNLTPHFVLGWADGEPQYPKEESLPGITRL